MRRKKKRNVLKRNSGFIVGCMLTAGVSFFAADIVMSQQMELFTALFESEEDPIIIADTEPVLAPESEENRVYETDAFTVTASGTVIKGVETESPAESEQDTPETDEEGNAIDTEDGESDQDMPEDSGSDNEGSDNEGSDNEGSNYSGNTYENNGSQGNDSYGDSSGNNDSYYDDSYYDDPYDNSGSSGSYDDNSNNDNWYEGPNIEIENSGNGDYSYDNSWDNSWDNSGSDSGNSSGGNSDVIVEGEPTDILLPGITTRYITESELYNYSDSMIRYIRNEIFAIHGRIFKSEDLREYFMSKSWYTPMYAPEDFDACMFSILNKYEIANLEVILKYEEALAAAN